LKISIWKTLALAVCPALYACGDDGSTVARGAGQVLTVEETVALLMNESLPNDHDVTFTVADLWLDYVLLAQAMADDPTLRQLDLSGIVDQQIDQELILALRDLTVQPDTVITDAQLEARFAEVTPGARVRVRHILFGYPESATSAQRDSVHALAGGIAQRIRAGGSFDQAAREHSIDQGSAAEGGDLGWFGQGELVATLEEAVFALAPGQVSDPVESVLGLHLLRVDDREIPTFDDTREEVRAFMLQERTQDAEATLIKSVEDGANVQVESGAATLVRSAAEDPGMRMSKRARARALVRYRGGTFTAGELLNFMQSRTPEFRFQIYGASDEAIEQNLLVGLAQRELLVLRAREMGIEIPAARRDALQQELRERLTDAARELDLAAVSGGSGESARAARKQQVEVVLRDMLSGLRDVMPLGSFSFVLRDEYSGQVFFTGVERVVERIAAVRGPDPMGPMGGQPGTEMPFPDGTFPGQPGGSP